MDPKRKKAAVYINNTEESEIKLILAKLHDFISDLDIKFYKEYIENTGSSDKLQKLLKDAKEKKFDIFIVWELAQIGCSIRELNIILGKFKKKI